MQTASESKLSSTKCSISASLSSSKQKSRSIRLTIDLNMPEKLPYPHFSLKKLILDQQKRTKSTKKQDPKRPPNPFGDADSDEEVAKLAAKFEKKYGSFDADGYIDKGEGYDENDPFVDNSEAYDELIPHNITTEFGGFYINCGELKFKSVDEDESEDEFEKANLLQKLKRKRNKIDDDEDDEIRIDISKKKPSKSAKPIKPIKSTKESNLNKKTSHPICDDNNAGMIDVKPKKQVAQESKIKDTKDTIKMARKKLSETNLQNLDHPKPRKSKNTFHQESHSSSMKKNNPLQQQQQPPPVISAATLAQNLYTTKIQQMITDSLLGNLPNSSGTNGSGSNSNASSHFMPQQTPLATVTSSIQYQHLNGLKANLLNLKTPYDIVTAIPAIKPINKDGLMSTEWNRYLTDLYAKTSSTKNRNKIYECFTKYINSFGVNTTQESLSFYAKQLLLETRNRPISGSALTKSSNSTKSSNASPSSSTNRSALYSTASLNVASNNSGYQTKKIGITNNNNPSSPVQQAINLSTNSSSNQSSFNEGLAGKLMINNNQQNDSSSNLSSTSSVTSRASPITPNNFKSNTKTMNLSLNKMKPDSYGISTQGLAMLQSLACLASTSSTSTSNASGQHQQKSPLITTTTSMPPPPIISSIQQQQQQQQSSLNRSTTPPTLPRSTSVPNPNSLLAAFTGSSIGGNSKSTSNCNSSSTIKQSASITPPSSSPPTTSTPHTLCSFFPVIPNMFNNANLISHLLNTSPSSSPGAIRQQQQQQQQATTLSNNSTNKQQTNPISTSSTASYMIHKNSLLLNSNNNVVGSNSSSTSSNKTQPFSASSLIASSQSLASSSATGNLLTSQSPTTISSMNRSNNQTSSHSIKQSVINFNKQQPSTAAQQTANCGLQIGLPNQNTSNR